MARCSEAFCRALEEYPRYLEDSQAAHVRDLGYQFLDLFQAMHSVNMQAGQQCYHMLRKVHTFAHLLDDLATEKLNPRTFSGWVDETFMHHIIEMSTGKEMDSLPSAVVRCWCTQALIRWQSTFA
jgi:hypothetical protein